MSGNNLFIDTDIVINFLPGDDTLTERLGHGELSLRDQQRLEKFPDECSIVDLHANVHQPAINIRRKYTLKLPDSIIAASTQYADLPSSCAGKSLRSIQEGSIIYYEKK